MQGLVGGSGDEVRRKWVIEKERYISSSAGHHCQHLKHDDG